MNVVMPTAPTSGPVGPIVMVFLLLFLIVGLVVSVRFVLRRVRDRVIGRVGANPLGLDADDAALAGGATGEVGGERGDSVPTGRALKERYLRGEISKSQYDEQLRALQIEEYLKGNE